MLWLRRRRAGGRGWVRVFAAVCLGMAVFHAASGWGQETAAKRTAGAYGIEIARETTYLTGPLLADGRVDYAEAVNAETSTGVTPENNAACLIARIVRTGEGKWWNVREDVLARMGVDAKAAKVTWTDSP